MSANLASFAKRLLAHNKNPPEESSSDSPSPNTTPDSSPHKFMDLKELSELLEANPERANDGGIQQILEQLQNQYKRPLPPPPPQTQTQTQKETIKKQMSAVLDNDTTMAKVASQIRNNKINKILILTGAGTSVSAGIPDFRTPGTGLYDNLAKYSLPAPEAVFDIDFYRENPQPFIQLSKELWPQEGHFKPTPTHCFIKLLDEKEVLMRNYTQNIDGLEVIAGVDEECVVECHGHYRSARCADCEKKQDINVVRSSILNDGKVPICKKCGGNCKPDIVFFGEDLPQRFHSLIRNDVKRADLLIVIGTSLLVSPVSQIPDMVGDFVPRMLINREKVGNFEAGEEDNYRDVFEAGDCDDVVMKFVKLLGWQEEFDNIMKLNDERHKSAAEGARSKEEVD